MSSGNTVFGITTVPPMPQDLVKGWILIVDRGPNGGTSTYTLGGIFGASGLSGRAWSPDHTAKLTLYRPYEDVAAEDARKAASRSGACGSPNLQGLPADKRADEGESAEQGLWHCHGDGVYHRHPDWRYRHPAPGQAVRATGDPVAPRLPTAPPGAYTRQQTGAPAIKTEGFGNWHWHGDIYHRHG
ncbi:hypothetical protein [Candidatus Poriferisodalis sp.]|uniref:hypothetical protein n=1 Tax=Candidatus Poriferisodalis sp. TaxID=3101277 RepID=UPI003B02E121